MMIRFSRNATALVAASAMAASPIALASPATAASPCTTDCIGYVTTTPAPQGVRLSFTTTASAKSYADILLGTTKIRSIPGLTVAGTTHTLRLEEGLKQNTVYTYRLTVTDSSNGVRTETGTFRTYARNASFEINAIAVSDDSDYAGAGEITGAVSFGGAVSQLWGGAQKSISSGSTAYFSTNPPRALRYGAGNTFTMLTQLTDDDSGAGLCTGGSAPAFNQGENDCFEWGTAGQTFTLPTGLGYHSSPFVHKTPNTARVKFSVNGYQIVRVYTVPLYPTNAKAVKGTIGGTAVVTWGAPTTTNYSPITAYKITAAPSGITRYVPASTRSLTLTGLPVGVKQKVNVYAANAAGYGPASLSTYVTP